MLCLRLGVGLPRLAAAAGPSAIAAGPGAGVCLPISLPVAVASVVCGDTVGLLGSPRALAVVVTALTGLVRGASRSPGVIGPLSVAAPRSARLPRRAGRRGRRPLGRRRHVLLTAAAPGRQRAADQDEHEHAGAGGHPMAPPGCDPAITGLHQPPTQSMKLMKNPTVLPVLVFGLWPLTKACVPAAHPVPPVLALPWPTTLPWAIVLNVGVPFQ